MIRRKMPAGTSGQGTSSKNAGASGGKGRDRGSERLPLRFIDEKLGKHPFHDSPLPATPPHIFLVTVDMVSPDFFHPSRPLSRELNLPALSMLMRDGALFSNAFATSPLCAPSRASYLTGRYPYVLGNGERAPDGLENELRPDDVIFPEYLKATGYVTRHCGKCHVGTKKFIDAFGENDRPWNRWAPPIYEDELFLEYQRQLGVKPQKYSREIVFRQRDRRTAGNSAGGWIVQADGRPFPLQAHYSYFLAQRAIEQMDAALASPLTREQPIYMQLDIFDPHQPLSIPEGFASREKALRAVMDLPDTYQKVQANDWGAFPDQPKIYDLYRSYWGLYDAQSLLDYRVGNALQMELVDQALHHLIRTLQKKGIYDNSWIVVMSDHGEMNGRWGLIDKGVYLYPDTLRALLVVKPPASMGVQQKRVEAPVSLLDLAPTLLSAVGIEPQARMDGRSLLPYLAGTARPADRDLLFSCGWHVGVNFACGIQSWDGKGNHHLYAYNASSEIDELYDLNAIEAENLAQHRECAALRKAMAGRLGELLQADSRWAGYWGSYRLDHFSDLEISPGDAQI